MMHDQKFGFWTSMLSEYLFSGRGLYHTWKIFIGQDEIPNLNKITFAHEHTRTTNDWTCANSWLNNTPKQIRFLPLQNAYVATAPGVRGDLTDARANTYLIAFHDCNWDTYDQYTSMSHNISILHHDETRREQYNCTCSANAKQFTCVHSLGVAMMRGTLVAPHAAQIQLLASIHSKMQRFSSEIQPLLVLISPPI